MAKEAILALLFAAGALGGESASPYVRAADIRRLTAAQAKKGLPVSIRGVITFVNAETGELFVQDSSAGIFVFVRNSSANQPLRAGQEVEVRGETAPGDFSSSVTGARITVTGSAPMPRPLVLPFDEISTGEQDSQWGRLTGVLRAGREEHGLLYLDAVTRGGAFLAIMKEYPADWAGTLIDSKVTLDGVLAALFNEHRQVTGVRMFVPSRRFARIVEAAPASPFELPVSSTLSIGAFRPRQDWNHRVHVRASVTAAVSRELIYVEDSAGSLPVELQTSCPSAPGAVLDIVGFPGNIENRPALQKAFCRPTGMTSAEHPTVVSADEIVPPEVASDGSGLTFAKATRNDLRLVSVTGTVVQAAKGALVQTVTLLSGGQTFNVTAPAAVRLTGEMTAPGTQLKTTGVCLITFDDYHRARYFRILVRRGDDFAVVSQPPWLTIRRASLILIPLVFLVAAGIIWIGVLRRHVSIKTKELQAANERLLQLSVEDALTGTANRRHFDEALRREISRCREKNDPLSLAIADLDHFKQVNDLYGHQRGDQYLIQVVAALKSVLVEVPGALLARYGGEEFAAVLPDVSQQQAQIVAEQMRQAVYNLAIFHEASPFDKRQTVSVGVTTLSQKAGWRDIDQLIGAADKALYEAKRLGRNRVIVSFPARQETEASLALAR